MITEPATMITDYFLTVVSLWCWNKTSELRIPPARSWSMSFLFLALASLTGGTTHGFALILPTIMYDVLWYTTLVSAGLADMFLLLGGIWWCLASQSLMTQILQFLAIAKFVVVTILVLLNPVFTIVAIDYGISFVGIIILRTFTTQFRSEGQYRDLLIAFGWGLLTGIIWFGEIGLTSWFTHTDVAHLTQLGVIFFLYRVLTRTSIKD